MAEDKNRVGEAEFLKNYNADRYARPSVASDVVVFTVTEEAAGNYRKLARQELRVLLVKRSEHPYLGLWALPGSFVGSDETVEEAAHRALKKETGAEDVYLEQLYTFSAPKRDPRMRVMSCTHMALADNKKLQLSAGCGVEKADWFRVDLKNQDGKFYLTLTGEPALAECVIAQSECPSDYRVLSADGIAFDHAAVIAYAVERLRNKLDYTKLAFRLLPEEFTLTELQQIYEVILGKTLLSPAFRRKLASTVEETGQFTQNVGHRPSQLYRLKKE